MADLLSAGFNVFQGTWLGSSGPSQVELVVLDWIKDWMGLGPEWGGLLTSGGSTANRYVGFSISLVGDIVTIRQLHVIFI